MRRWVATALAGLAIVAAGADGARSRPLTPQELAEADDFALGNVVWVLHHEIGHLLVDQFQLPILGREEDAADNLATVILIEQKRPQLNDFLVAAVDAFFLMSDQRARRGVVPPVFDDHGLDQQRAFQMACLMYGSDPVAFAALVDTIELPQSRRDNCAYEFELARSSWFAVLAPHRRGILGAASPVTIDYAPADGQMGEVRRVMAESGVLEGVAGYLGANFDLTRPAVLRAETCAGQATAYFDPASATVSVCYELFDYFHKLLADHLSGT
jgi:hypothetical protein